MYKYCLLPLGIYGVPILFLEPVMHQFCSRIRRTKSSTFFHSVILSCTAICDELNWKVWILLHSKLYLNIKKKIAVKRYFDLYPFKIFSGTVCIWIFWRQILKLSFKMFQFEENNSEFWAFLRTFWIKW